MRWYDATQETVWYAITRSDPQDRRRRYDLRDLFDSVVHDSRIWWAGLAITGIAACLTWTLQGPNTITTTHLMMDMSQPGGHTAATFSSAALLNRATSALNTPSTRLAVLRSAGGSSVFPDLRPEQAADPAVAFRRLDEHYLLQSEDGGFGLVVSAWHRDAGASASLDHALVTAILSSQPEAAANGIAATQTAGSDTRAAMEAARTRLLSDLDAADRRAASLSQSMTDLARDMVAALRATDNRSASTEISDQGAALLADLQIKRIQLATKYQEGYPALVALDAEIGKLRAVVSTEQRRSSVVRSAANPVFTALATERRRIGAELDSVNAKRAMLHTKIETTDRQLVAVTPLVEPPHLIAGAPVMSYGPDPRLLSVPLMLLVGLSGTVLLQWLLLRERQQIVTAAEAELTLGLPVLRCLDSRGVSLRLLERPSLRLRAPQSQSAA